MVAPEESREELIIWFAKYPKKEWIMKDREYPKKE
jgi:hypothetical protein